MTEEQRRLHLDIMFTRKIICGIIKQAYDDVTNDTTYAKTYVNSNVNRDKEGALYFVRSKLFEDLCVTLDLPTEKLRYAMFK